MSKPIYKLVDSKGRVYIPKFMREFAEIKTGDIVRLEVEQGKISVRRVRVIEAEDQSPEAAAEFVRSVIDNMDCKTKLALAERLIALAGQET